MAHFIVTFRIKDNASYQERYDSFMEKIKELAKYSPWDQTTSFLAFEANDANVTASSICSTLFLNTKFNYLMDIMVVIDLDRKTKATHGKIEYDGLLDAGLGF